MSRMHNELPPLGMGKAVKMHRSGTKPDAAKALTHTRETRDAIDAFIADFGNKSNFALAYMDNPDRDLIGEVAYLEYWTTAVANRLDLVIASLEREAKK